MVTIEIDGIKGSGETAKQARAALNKARKAAKEAQEQQERESNEALALAKDAALSILMAYHRKQSPDAWIVATPDDSCCCNYSEDTDRYIFHNATGSAAFDFASSWRLSRVLEHCSGIMAVCSVRGDDVFYFAVGVSGCTLRTFDLPADVGNWLFYSRGE